MLHRFSKRCRPFNQNGTELNDKNYGKKTTVPRAFYGTEFGTFFLASTVCDRLQENRAQRSVRKYRERLIDFFKMYCFKPTEGNG